MARAPKKIKVAPGSELARLLDEASGESLLLEKDGIVDRLSTEEEDIWAGYDPEQVIAALDRTAGTWADIDVDALITKLYRVREEGLGLLVDRNAVHHRC